MLAQKKLINGSYFKSRKLHPIPKDSPRSSIFNDLSFHLLVPTIDPTNWQNYSTDTVSSHKSRPKSQSSRRLHSITHNNHRTTKSHEAIIEAIQLRALHLNFNGKIFRFSGTLSYWLSVFADALALGLLIGSTFTSTELFHTVTK